MASDKDLALQEIKRRQEAGAWDWALGAAEVLPVIGSALVAEPLAGFAGIAAAPYGRGGDVVEGAREAMSYQPRTAEAKRIMGALGSAGEWAAEKAKMIPAGYAGMYQAATGGGLKGATDAIGSVRGADFSRTLGDATLSATGSPALAAAAYSAPVALAEMVGLKGASRLGGKQYEMGDITEATTRRKSAGDICGRKG